MHQRDDTRTIYCMMARGMLALKLLLFGLFLLLLGSLLLLGTFSNAGSGICMLAGLSLGCYALVTNNRSIRNSNQYVRNVQHPGDTAAIVLLLSEFIQTLKLLLFGIILVLASGALHLGVLGRYGGIVVMLGVMFAWVGFVVDPHMRYDEPETKFSLELLLVVLGLGFLTKSRAKRDSDTDSGEH